MYKLPIVSPVKFVLYCNAHLFGIIVTYFRYYTKFDGFVVIHGTDTMAYTASALSFMLENLGKSVILTGSQVTSLI